MGRRRPVAVRALPAHDLAQESHDVVGRDVVEIAELLPEAERHEAIEEPHAVVDRRLGQPSLLAKIGLVLHRQALDRRQRLLRRLRPLGHTGRDKNVDEALKAVSLLAVLARVHRFERGGARL